MHFQLRTLSTRLAFPCHFKALVIPPWVCFRSSKFSTTNARKFEPSADPSSPSVALVAGLALGLPLTLWTYKCLLMILLQRKLIYMGYLPPGAREEDLTAYRYFLRDMEIEEIKLYNSDQRCTLHGIVVQNRAKPPQLSRRPRVILLYLQGNAGNPLHRIPMFKTLLGACANLEPVIVAVAPRSYWKSSRRTPTEDGLLSDYLQVFQYIRARWPTEPVIFYGHSLGASVGTCLVSQMSDVDQNVRGLILENPFSSIPDMVRTLYPNRLLPYHHLGPFVWDKWDAVRAAREAPRTSVLRRLLCDNGLLVLLSENDEVVPANMGRDICDAGKAREPLIIRGALHENAWENREWGISIRMFLQEVLK